MLPIQSCIERLIREWPWPFRLACRPVRRKRAHIHPRLLLVAGGGFVGIPRTPQIQNDYGVVLRQLRHNVPPHIPRFSKAMEQNNRLTSPAHHIMQAYILVNSRLDRSHLW